MTWGFTKVYYFPGGPPGWKDAGYPLARAPAPALARPPAAGKVYRIGYLAPSDRVMGSGYAGKFVDELRHRGWVADENLHIEYQWADNQHGQLPALGNELAQAKVDVMVVLGSAAARAAMKATTTTPIVFLTAGDPVESGFATSLARPGGNLTGVTLIWPELAGKQLELLRETVPDMGRVGVVSAGGRTQWLEELRGAATAMGVTIYPVEITGRRDILPAFSELVQTGVDAAIVFPDPRLALFEIARLAREHKLPTISTREGWPRVGGLMSYGPGFDIARRAAALVDKILKGADPGDLPVEQPTTFELWVNMGTAKASTSPFPNPS